MRSGVSPSWCTKSAGEERRGEGGAWLLTAVLVPAADGGVVGAGCAGEGGRGREREGGRERDFLRMNLESRR